MGTQLLYDISWSLLCILVLEFFIPVCSASLAWIFVLQQSSLWLDLHEHKLVLADLLLSCDQSQFHSAICAGLSYWLTFDCSMINLIFPFAWDHFYAWPNFFPSLLWLKISNTPFLLTIIINFLKMIIANYINILYYCSIL